MKFFFALWPDDGVRAQLARWSRELHLVCGGRPTRTENLHLTLTFIGEVADERVTPIARAAGEVALRRGVLVLDRPGYWKHNRIAWAGAAVVPEELEALVSELRGALEHSHIRFDAKPFVSHVTLLRDAREPRAMPGLEPIRWELGGFALVRSPARGSGSYEVLERWELKTRC